MLTGLAEASRTEATATGRGGWVKESLCQVLSCLQRGGQSSRVEGQP